MRWGFGQGEPHFSPVKARPSRNLCLSPRGYPGDPEMKVGAELAHGSTTEPGELMLTELTAEGEERDAGWDAESLREEFGKP